MVEDAKPTRSLEPEEKGHLQWGAALWAGFIAGAVLLFVPRGSPWSAVTFFSRVVMGRIVPFGVNLPLPAIWLIHLAIAEIYGLAIARLLVNVSQARAILGGGLIGLVLYLINLGVVTAVWPAWRGSEGVVLVTHVVFGLIAGGAYRGLLRRRMPAGSGAP